MPQACSVLIYEVGYNNHKLVQRNFVLLDLRTLSAATCILQPAGHCDTLCYPCTITFTAMFTVDVRLSHVQALTEHDSCQYINLLQADRPFMQLISGQNGCNKVLVSVSHDTNTFKVQTLKFAFGK